MSHGVAHSIELRQIFHQYGVATALESVSLDIAPSELVALLGPSGCGKTTLLRIIAGFVRQTSGEVLVDGQPIDSIEAGKRGIGIVFQNYALFPHLSVIENVAYGLLAQGMARKVALAQASETLDRVRMGALGARMPRELSGGQQQRVALARALAISPRIMLLDEPFSALDKALRLDMQSEIKTILKGTGVTSILVTHDQDEAMSMADRIVVLNKGRVEQIGGPVDVYDNPASLFVGKFIGSMNLLKGRAVVLEGGKGGFALDDDSTQLACPPAARYGSGTPVILGVRPENLRFAETGFLRAHVSQILPLGPMDVVEVNTSSGACLRVASPRSSSNPGLAIGESVGIDVVDAARCSIFSP